MAAKPRETYVQVHLYPGSPGQVSFFPLHTVINHMGRNAKIPDPMGPPPPPPNPLHDIKLSSPAIYKPRYDDGRSNQNVLSLHYQTTLNPNPTPNRRANSSFHHPSPSRVSPSQQRRNHNSQPAPNLRHLP